MRARSRAARTPPLRLLLNVGPEEVPRRLCEPSRPIGADVAAPDHRCAEALESDCQPERLRVVQDHDVPGADHVAQSPVGAIEHTLVGASLRRSQRTAVPEMLVEKVVDSLGHAEEVRARPHDQPAGVKPTGSRARQHRTQDLGNTTADPSSCSTTPRVPRATRERARALRSSAPTPTSGGCWQRWRGRPAPSRRASSYRSGSRSRRRVACGVYGPGDRGRAARRDG